MANKVYVVQETAIEWSDDGSPDFSPQSIGAGGSSRGRQGALYDFGAAARPRRYAWRAWVKFATTPVIGQMVEIYWKSAADDSGVAHPDNDDGSGDADVSAEDKLRNLTPIGAIVVDEAPGTPSAVEFVASGTILIDHEHGAPVFWNATDDDLSSTGSDHGFMLTPIPDEIQ